MPDACFLFTVDATLDEVFKAIASPEGISTWWSQETDGAPEMGDVFAAREKIRRDRRSRCVR